MESSVIPYPIFRFDVLLHSRVLCFNLGLRVAAQYMKASTRSFEQRSTFYKKKAIYMSFDATVRILGNNYVEDKRKRANKNRLQGHSINYLLEPRF